MRILIHSINFAPELTGIGKYTGELAAWLAERGHEVRVVTAPPYYPAWSVRVGFRNWWRGGLDELPRYAGSPEIGRLMVWRCPLWVPSTPGGGSRLLHLATFALSSLPVMLRQVVWRPDAVWVVEPTLFCAPTAAVVAQLCGAKTWLHVQDFEVDAAFDLDLLKGKKVRRWVTRAERWLVRRFDKVSTISHKMLQRLLDKGVAPAKAVLAPNWVDIAEFTTPTVEGVAAYRREMKIRDSAVVALYSGNMGGKQGLNALADVARLCPAVAFVFCGNGVGRASLMEHCVGLLNVQFLDLQPAERLPALLATADIHLLPQKAEAADLVMPSKLTGMLASARPVVATARPDTELADVVRSCGLVVPPEDSKAMADAVLALAKDPALRERLGTAGYAYAKANLEKQAVLEKFEADLLALVGHRAA